MMNLYRFFAFGSGKIQIKRQTFSLKLLRRSISSEREVNFDISGDFFIYFINILMYFYSTGNLKDMDMKQIFIFFRQVFDIIVVWVLQVVVLDIYLEEVGVCFMFMFFRLFVLQECIGVLMEWMGEFLLMLEFIFFLFEVFRRGDFGLGVCFFICVFLFLNVKNLYKFIMVF